MCMFDLYFSKAGFIMCVLFELTDIIVHIALIRMIMLFGTDQHLYRAFIRNV